MKKVINIKNKIDILPPKIKDIYIENKFLINKNTDFVFFIKTFFKKYFLKNMFLILIYCF
jgi:hypothetical protein